MRIVIAAGLTAFVVTLFWLGNLYRRARVVPYEVHSGWRDLEQVDSV
jgi:hypothetical protein